MTSEVYSDFSVLWSIVGRDHCSLQNRKGFRAEKKDAKVRPEAETRVLTDQMAIHAENGGTVHSPGSAERAFPCLDGTCVTFTSKSDKREELGSRRENLTEICVNY